MASKAQYLGKYVIVLLQYLKLLLKTVSTLVCVHVTYIAMQLSIYKISG